MIFIYGWIANGPRNLIVPLPSYGFVSFWSYKCLKFEEPEGFWKKIIFSKVPIFLCFLIALDELSLMTLFYKAMVESYAS